jgi:hypothetical protein
MCYKNRQYEGRNRRSVLEELYIVPTGILYAEEFV